jgi:uncharacterized protein YmfQ (DUF2313 family)
LTDLMSYLPPYYLEYLEMTELMESEGVELTDLSQSVQDVLDQFFVDTATYSLDQWEYELGIPTDLSKPNADRRSVIKSKLRGSGTVTVSLMQNVASAYDRGQIEVTEQPALFQFTVRFVDTLGAPPNLNDLKAAIEAIKPAHLAVVFAFKYLTINQVHGVMTINQLQTHKLSDFAPFNPV